MKISGVLFISLIISNFSYSQQNILNDNLFTREIFSFGKYDFLLASEKNKGYLLKLENNVVKDTLTTFKSEQNLNGFNKIYINEKRIYIVFDLLNKLTINDSIQIKSNQQRNNILCLNNTGKLMWNNYFQPELSRKRANDFRITENKKNIFIGFNSWGKIIIKNDTIGKFNYKNNAFILKLNKNGKYIDVLDFSKNYNSSRIYQLKKRKDKPIAITLNYLKTTRTTNKKLQFTCNQKRIKKNYLEIDSLQIIDYFYSKPFDYILTWEGYFIKIKNKKVKKTIELKSQIPKGALKQTNITQRMIFDNGDYFSYVSLFEFRDKGKTWSSINSLKKIYFDIKHIDKNTFKIISHSSKVISDTKNWVSIESCQKNRIGIIIDGKYRFIK